MNSQFGATLVNNNGRIASIVGTRDYSWTLEPRQRTGELVMTCIVPNTVTPGQYQNDFTDVAWEAMIKEQLDQGLPVYYWGRRDGGQPEYLSFVLWS